MANPILRNCTGFHDKVKYIKADENYSVIHWVFRKPEMVSRTLLRYEEALPDWLRVSQQYLINPAFIASMSKGKNLFVTLVDGTKIPISRRRAPGIRSALTKSMHV